MGNLNKYSKGCRTCVRRRVKCDERKPDCRRCNKGGFQCDGYEALLFVDARMQATKGSPSAPGPSLSSNALAICTNTMYSHRRVAIMESTTSVFTSDHYGGIETTKVPEYLPICLSPTPPSDESFVLYTINNLGKNDWMVMAYQNISQIHTSTLSPQSFLMGQCLLALAKIFYGVKRQEKGVMREGMNLYSGALNTLSSSFGIRESNVTIETVVSVLLLSMIESILPTGKTSWMSHILGLERLFALCRPSKLERDFSFEHAMVKSCRPVMILGAFFTRKPSLMGDPAWKAMMRDQGCHDTLNVTERWTSPSLSFLLDTLAKLPQLFTYCDECTLSSRREPAKTSPQFIAALCSRVGHLQKIMRDWKDQWDFNLHDNMYEVLSTNEPERLRISDWKTVFYFSSVDVAITFGMYHSVVILVNSIAAVLIQAGFWISSRSEYDIIKPRVEISSQIVLASIRSSIQNICRTIEYHLHTTHLSQEHADYYLFFPIHVARRASIQLRQSVEATWLTEALEAMRLRYPMGIWAGMDFGDRFNGIGEGMFG